MSHEQIRQAARAHGVTQDTVRRWLRLARAVQEPKAFVILRYPNGEYRAFDKATADAIAAASN
jgi:transposase-like protein